MILAMRDKTIEDLKRTIEERKRLLLLKHKSLKTTIKENDFLADVAQDYNKYYSFIKKQKEDQIAAFEIINRYLEKIISDSKITEKSLKEAKNEQREIIEIIDGIRKELEDAMK
jgi:hypothetical protein